MRDIWEFSSALWEDADLPEAFHLGLAAPAVALLALGVSLWLVP